MATMGGEAMEQVLRLVAEGRLSPEEAAPLLDALDEAPESTGRNGNAQPESGAGPGRARAVRVQVMERGRQIVNVRVPLALGRMAIAGMPGISESNAARIREAIAEGLRGPILEVLDEGDGVRITLE
jgi:hypothetical protein